MRAIGGLLSLFLLLNVSVGHIWAEEAYQPIYTNNFGIGNASWSSDGSLFTFQDYISDTATPISLENNWHAYNVDRKSLTTSSLWPQPLVLPQSLPIGLKPLPTLAKGAFTFVSPDQNYLVYPAEDEG